jgi:hypothetical protein
MRWNEYSDTAKLNVVKEPERSFWSSGLDMSTNIIPGSQRSIYHIVKIFSQITGLMVLLLYRVYESSKQSSGRNGKQRNSTGTAPLNKLQVNLQVAGKCLRDVDEVINGGLKLANRIVIRILGVLNQISYFHCRVKWVSMAVGCCHPRAAQCLSDGS